MENLAKVRDYGDEEALDDLPDAFSSIVSNNWEVRTSTVGFVQDTSEFNMSFKQKDEVSEPLDFFLSSLGSVIT